MIIGPCPCPGGPALPAQHRATHPRRRRRAGAGETPAGDGELDPEARLPLDEEAHRLLLDGVPAVFVSNQAAVFLVKPEVTGYATAASDGEWPGQFSSPLTLDVERAG